MDSIKTSNGNHSAGQQLQCSSNVALSGKEAIPFTVKGPIPVRLSDSSGDQLGRTGCSILELTFQYPSQVGELVFSNYYTAWMSIFTKRMPNKSKGSPTEKVSGGSSRVGGKGILERSFSVDLPGNERGGSRSSLSPIPYIGTKYTGASRQDGGISRRPSTASTTPEEDFESMEFKTETMSSGILKQHPFSSKRRHQSGSLSSEIAAAMETRPWELSIEMKKLMPWPHFEYGSQDLISIPATESMVEWRDVIAMRLVLHQPSTVWKRFTIEEVNVFRHLPKRGFSHYDDMIKQRDNWFSVLKMNTKAVLAGQLVEPESTTEDGTTS